ncbi:MAG: HNH endonuclease [Dehalococcoidia bacterium]
MMYFDEAPAPRRTTQQEKEYLYQKQKGKCNYCGCRLAIHHLQADHKVPVDRDGSNTLSNKQLLCGPCNRRKGDLTDGEFRRRYRLPGSRIAKCPPSRAIPQEYFQAISKEIAAKNAARRKRDNEWFGL